MKKKIIMLAAILLMFASVASGSSINGDYKGNPIVNVFVNGSKVISDVPAMIIDGTTMIPLRAVAESMGGVIGWDQNSYSVTILTSNANNTPTVPTTEPQPQQTKIKGPLSIYSHDGKTYLGKLTSDIYDSDSVFNTYGTYGSEYSTDSIWNEYGTYGSMYSSKSAFNDYASEPPLILDADGNIVGYLTTNKNIKGGVSPIGIYEFLKENGY